MSDCLEISHGDKSQLQSLHEMTDWLIVLEKKNCGGKIWAKDADSKQTVT